MKNIVLMFGAIIMAILLNACGFASNSQDSQDSRIDSGDSNALSSDFSANQKADSKHTISRDWEVETFQNEMSEGLAKCKKGESGFEKISCTLGLFGEWRELCEQGEGKYCILFATMQMEFLKDEPMQFEGKNFAVRMQGFENINDVLKLLQKSCDSGYAMSCLSIGGLFYGELPDFADLIDKQKSAEYFSKACDFGSFAGCGAMIEFYEDGIGGIAKSSEKAKFYRIKSIKMLIGDCEAGEKMACEAIDKKGGMNRFKNALIRLESQ